MPRVHTRDGRHPAPACRTPLDACALFASAPCVAGHFAVKLNGTLAPPPTMFSPRCASSPGRSRTRSRRCGIAVLTSNGKGGAHTSCSAVDMTPFSST